MPRRKRKRAGRRAVDGSPEPPKASLPQVEEPGRGSAGRAGTSCPPLLRWLLELDDGQGERTGALGYGAFWACPTLPLPTPLQTLRWVQDESPSLHGLIPPLISIVASYLGRELYPAPAPCFVCRSSAGFQPTRLQLTYVGAVFLGSAPVWRCRSVNQHGVCCNVAYFPCENALIANGCFDIAMKANITDLSLAQGLVLRWRYGKRCSAEGCYETRAW
jgi:hypothetical protein